MISVQDDPAAACGGQPLCKPSAVNLHAASAVLNYCRCCCRRCCCAFRTILVQHIEDIDSIIRLVKHIRYKWIDRHAFRQLMMATLGSRVISPAHIDFLWQAYDR